MFQRLEVSKRIVGLVAVGSWCALGAMPGEEWVQKAQTLDLGGKSECVKRSVCNGWEDLYPITLANGTLTIAEEYKSRSNHLTLEKGGTLVFGEKARYRAGDGMGMDRWEKTRVKDGGAFEMRAAQFVPWHTDYAIEKGGRFVLAPGEATFSNSWFPCTLENKGGTLSLPKDVTWEASGKAGATFTLRQTGGTLEMGGVYRGFAVTSLEKAGRIKVELAGGTIRATGTSGFVACDCTVKDGAHVTVDVAAGGVFDFSCVRVAAGAHVTKVGGGTLVLAHGKRPEGLEVKEGTVIEVPSIGVAQVAASENPLAITRPDDAKWQYEPKTPMLAKPLTKDDGHLHGRVTALERLTGETAAGDERQKTWRATAWRNEYAHGQFVVWTGTERTRLHARVSPLVNAAGEAIPAAAVKTRFVRYTLGHAARKGVLTMPEKLYGDCLDDVETLDLPANGYRPVWVSVRVPEGTTPGVYTGTLEMRACPNEQVVFPIELKVIARTLTAPAQWPMFLDFWQHPWALARYHGVKPFSDVHFAIMEPYFRALADLGQKVITATVTDNPWGQANSYDMHHSMVEVTKRTDGSWAYDYTVFDRFVTFAKKCGLGPQIQCYTLAGFKTDYTDAATGCRHLQAADRQAFWRAFLKDFRTHVAEKGWLGNVYLALDESEPDVLRASEKLLREAAPGLKLAMAGNKKPSAYKGVEIDAYSQGLGCMTPEFLKEVKTRQAQGKTTSYYICCGPSRPNTFLTSPLCESAWQGIYVAATGIDGLLRWAAWSWPRDPLFDASFFHWTPGDTFLIYPGPRLSMRYERLRDGFEMAEKIRLLKQEGTLPPALENLLDYHAFKDTAEFYAERVAAIEAELDKIR